MGTLSELCRYYLFKIHNILNGVCTVLLTLLLMDTSVNDLNTFAHYCNVGNREQERDKRNKWSGRFLTKHSQIYFEKIKQFPASSLNHCLCSGCVNSFSLQCGIITHIFGDLTLCFYIEKLKTDFGRELIRIPLDCLVACPNGL